MVSAKALSLPSLWRSQDVPPPPADLDKETTAQRHRFSARFLVLRFVPLGVEKGIVHLNQTRKAISGVLYPPWLFESCDPSTKRFLTA